MAEDFPPVLASHSLFPFLICLASFSPLENIYLFVPRFFPFFPFG